MKSQFKISDPAFWQQINSAYHNGGGIYKLILKDKTDFPVRIGRLLKKDENGVLYIGKATSFLDRVIELKKSLSPDHFSSNHECGVRFKSFLKNHFEFENLWVELIQTNDIDQLEIEELLKYETEFGELPPMNRRK